MKRILVLATTAAFAASAAHAAPGGFKRLDTNGDGSITQAELAAGLTKRFGAIDTDGNRRISRAEHDAHRAKVAERRAERRAAAGKQDSAYAGQEGHAKHGDRGDRFAKRDANSDGQLSFDEFAARMQKRFVRIDSNSDGTLSADELAVARKVRAERRG